MPSPARPAAAASRVPIVAYWVTTLIIAAELAVGGVWDILRTAYVREVLEQQLGYPSYFAVIIGVWKVPGALVLVGPRGSRVKEWVYAGAVFTYTGAAASHLAVGDGVGALGPVGFAVIALVSWALRPPARRNLAADPDPWMLSRQLARRSTPRGQGTTGPAWSPLVTRHRIKEPSG
jgi:DoxX-like family